MIVKDESAVIRRCFDSVKDIIDYWVIVDTGSTDYTKEIIEEFKQEVPGELHEAPWKNFAWNRSEALKLAKDKADYILIIDADEILRKDKDFKLPELTADMYSIYTDYSGLIYSRVQLVNNSIDWRYESVIHEYITCDDIANKTKEILPGLTNFPGVDGNRSRDPNKFKRDVLVLEAALLDEPNNSRYMFYLAQSYKDAGDYANAIDRYQKRIEMGGWDQEIFYSYYMIGNLMIKLNMHWTNALGNYLMAFETKPHRLEPIYKIVHKYRTSGKYNLAYSFGKMCEASIKTDDLFIERSIYKFSFWDEFSISAYWAGDYESSYNIIYDLFNDNKVPISHMERVYKNLLFARDKLNDKPLIELNTNDKEVVLVTGISDYGRTIVCNMLNDQDNVNVTHEYSMRSDIYQDTTELNYNEEQINIILNYISNRTESVIGDASGIYLNHIDYLINAIPNIKIILVGRIDNSVISISDEIDEYNTKALELESKYPENIKIVNYIDIKENEKSQQTFYEFIGIKEYKVNTSSFITMLE